MCLLILIVVMAYMLVAMFVQTAYLLLPWTIPAGVLGTLCGWQAAVRVRAFRGREMLAAGGVALVATAASGFAAFEWLPPSPPPPVPPQDVLKLMTELPRPNVTLEKLREMFPIHLGITAMLSVLVSAGLARPRRKAVGRGVEQTDGGEA